MTTFWRNGRACIAALRPVYGDAVVMTTLGGEVAALDRVGDYDAAIDRALKLAAKHPYQPVKVLPMRFIEALAFCRITVHEFMADMTDDQWRAHCIAVCTPALTDLDPRVRADALEVLTSLGVTPQ